MKREVGRAAIYIGFHLAPHKTPVRDEKKILIQISAHYGCYLTKINLQSICSIINPTQIKLMTTSVSPWGSCVTIKTI